MLYSPNSGFKEFVGASFIHFFALLSTVPFGWEDRKVKIENKEEMEKRKDRRDFNFPHLYLIREWKSREIENRICINLLSYPYYITYFI